MPAAADVRLRKEQEIVFIPAIAERNHWPELPIESRSLGALIRFSGLGEAAC